MHPVIRDVALLLPILLPVPAAAGEEPVAPAPAKAEPRDLAALLEPIRAKHDLPALAAALLRGGEIEALGAAGVRERGKPEKATAEDLWHLGSCTKAMTATLCGLLVEEGKLDFGTELLPALGEGAAKADPGWKGCTLGMLLRNRGGASPEVPPPLWAAAWNHRGTDREARRDLVAGFLALPPKSKPGTAYAYSNMNFVLAGAVAEEAAGKGWQDLMRERLFRPLGMERAGFGAPGTAAKVDQPRGHRADGTPVPPGPGSDNPAAIGPAGTVHASLRDWARFVSLHLRGARGEGGLLKQETFRTLQVPPADGRERYAMGWMETERPWAGGRVLTHAGSNTMWYCVAWLAPERDFAVLVCTNQGGEVAAKGCDDAAAALVTAAAAGR
ncbi:MAG: beta-lactamase family protein [Planctomycetes bacterium]|nr:beta-lactamase family protein [Planctomycetota bacterium]